MNNELTTLQTVTINQYLYKNVFIEIKSWENNDPSHMFNRVMNWTYYIHLSRRNYKNFNDLWIEPEVSDHGFLIYHYDKTPVISEMPIHGGITFFKKNLPRLKVNGESVVIGCDYQHIWDDEKEFTLEDVLADAKKSIDYLDELQLLIK